MSATPGMSTLSFSEGPDGLTGQTVKTIPVTQAFCALCDFGAMTPPNLAVHPDGTVIAVVYTGNGLGAPLNPR